MKRILCLVTALCMALALLIPFSRLYLGVHTPLDVGVSFLIGWLLVLAFYPLLEEIGHRGEVGEARRARAGGLDDLERGVEHPGPRDAERDLQHLVDRRAGEAQEHEKIALVFVHAPEDHQHKEHEQRLAAELRHALHERVEQRSAQLGDGAQAVQIPFHKGSHSFLSTFFRKNEVKHGAL